MLQEDADELKEGLASFEASSDGIEERVDIVPRGSAGLEEGPACLEEGLASFVGSAQLASEPDGLEGRLTGFENGPASIEGVYAGPAA